MGRVVEVFYIQRAGYDGADALVIFRQPGGYADPEEFFDGGILRRVLRSFCMASVTAAPVAPAVVSAAQVG